MPMLRMYMYSKGIQLYCAPTADDRDTWLSSMQHIALEGRCFVLSSCQYLLRIRKDGQELATVPLVLSKGWRNVRKITGNYVSLTGTFSGNPVSCAVGIAVLKELRRVGVYESLYARGRRLMEALQTSLDKAGIAARVSGEPPAFQPWFTANEVFDQRACQSADPLPGFALAQALLDRGVLKGHEKFFVSTVHSDADIDFTIEAIDDAVQEIASARKG